MVWTIAIAVFLGVFVLPVALRVALALAGGVVQVLLLPLRLWGRFMDALETERETRSKVSRARNR